MSVRKKNNWVLVPFSRVGGGRVGTRFDPSWDVGTVLAFGCPPPSPRLLMSSLSKESMVQSLRETYYPWINDAAEPVVIFKTGSNIRVVDVAAAAAA